jgi:exodeoxyribonuclease VIII
MVCYPDNGEHTMPRTALMIDLETMGTTHDAAILSIGAVIFDLNGEEIHATLHDTVDLEDNQIHGRKIDASTVLWWMKQSKNAQLALTQNPMHLKKALNRLTELVQDWKPGTVWANSPTFDLDILRHAYKSLGLACPWQYWAERDYRTLKDFTDMPDFTSGTTHNALDDALAQATGVQWAYLK